MESVRKNILDGTPADVVERYESLPSIAKQSDFGVLDRNVVVVDTETTGLSFTSDELIQIAAARIEKGEVVDWYVTFVNPGKFLTEDIMHLTNIHDEDLIGAPTPEEALAGLVEFAGDAIMVAHNAEFDRTFVTHHPAGYPLLQNIWLDSLDLSRIALPRLKSHRLIDLVRTFGAPTSTHRADDDVAATCVVYRILLAAISQMPHSLVREIAHMAPQSEWSTGFAFREMEKMMLVASGQTKPAFSLYKMRSERIGALPARRPRKDADELVGALAYPTREEIEQAFAAEGLLGRIYPDYELRQEQLQMALAVRDAFENHENLLVEAGTGVGKSMAYLVVAALFAQKNQVAVGVATKTNSLLDQLVFQEMPALAAALTAEGDVEPLAWAPLKGMTHYPCLRKIARVVDAGPQMREVQGRQVSQAPALAALLSYVEQSEFSDIDSLKIDYRSLPRYAITTTNTECLRRKCPYYNKLCFVHGARRRAESADVLVTNHTLLFCDVAADGGLLPTARHWIMDEAHSVEAEARSAFALAVDSDQLARLIDRVSETAGGRNIFTRAERALSGNDEGQMKLFLGLVAKARKQAGAFESAAVAYMAGVKELLFFDAQAKSKRGGSYETVDIWINDELRSSTIFGDLSILANELIDACDRLIAAEQDLVGLLEGIDEAAVAQREIAAHALEVREVRKAAEVIFAPQPSPLYVYQAVMNRKRDRFVDHIDALLLDVGQKMNEDFYTRTQSVVYASATLTVNGSFDAFKGALGLGQSEFSKFSQMQLDSSYDFDSNMLVYVVSDMPEPNQPGYLDALSRLLVEVHRANRGSILTLFTNRREMETTYDTVSNQLRDDDLRVVCQKWGLSTKGLRDEFIADERLSLMALKSFWEGFDAPGPTLRGVVIPKLPFARPTDPLYCERAARDDRAWWHYVLPQAAIETKQAAGRLIRKADDRGVLILADSRLLSKAYGKTFLNSLQSKSVRVRTIDEIVAALRLMDL